MQRCCDVGVRKIHTAHKHHDEKAVVKVMRIQWTGHTTVKENGITSDPPVTMCRVGPKPQRIKFLVVF